ncbi:hypothetical protein SAMN04489764_1880 [Thermostaphylospora chromogena]|uniref:Uncharacterized protein n=1 Tax=Thermostaphylospora chromogena TaxID=35622 RepID=A0A1H1D8V4_9ACTN|nr:hypothetical protein SAMN04489764_1880 [Thermostaphylospora chromogena]
MTAEGRRDRPPATDDEGDAVSAERDREEQRRRRERDRGSTMDAVLHDMGGDIGPASVRPPAGEREERKPGEPGFRVEGPVDEERHGEIVDEEAGPSGPDPPPREEIIAPERAGHVGADLEWSESDADDPDAGSGRTDADDGGYLPGEATGRPYRG